MSLVQLFQLADSYLWRLDVTWCFLRRGRGRYAMHGATRLWFGQIFSCTGKAKCAVIGIIIPCVVSFCFLENILIFYSIFQLLSNSSKISISIIVAKNYTSNINFRIVVALLKFEIFHVN